MKLLSSVMCFSISIILLAGCEERGFRLPQGDVEKGKAAFVVLQCNNCHRVAGVDLAPPVSTVATNVTIGGEVSYIKSYGELVTCVINPSHEFATGFKKSISADAGSLSPMPEYNNVMTVRQMVDIVAFLRSTYTQHPSRYITYGQNLPAPISVR